MFMTLARRRSSGDAGAVAVIVAISMTAIFGIAAMAVDLGNGWARKRASQNDADFAALAGAASLPNQANALQAAYSYLQQNLPRSDDGADAGPITNYSDGNLYNGEITFPSNTKIRVYVPQRKVSFGLANAIGVSNTSVTANATAEIRSPKRVLPFFLSLQCSTPGQHILKSSSGNSNQYNFETPVANGNNAPSAGNAVNTNPSPIVQYQPGTATIAGNNLSGALTQVALIGPDGSQVTPTPVVRLTDANHISFPIPALGVAGTWYVQVRAQNTDWSTNNQNGNNAAPSFTVTAGQPTDCNQSSTGDFGIIDSPRNSPSVNSNSQLLDFNLSLGLDHGLACFPGTGVNWPATTSCTGGTYQLPPPTQTDNCRMSPGNAPIAGGILDNDPSRDDANCIDIDNGFQASAITQGLITGGRDANVSFTGHLAQNISTGCAAPTGGSNPRVLTIGSTTYSINNDTLDCYFQPGVSLADLLTGSTPLFKSSIFDSPRFFFVPVVDYNIHPPNGYYPIVDFAAVFITDADVAVPATPANGVNMTGGGSQIDNLHVFVFPIQTLPDLANNGGTIPFIGAGPKIPVLVD